MMIVMERNVREAIEEFKREVKKLYGKRLKCIIVYGSHARGEATEDSDIDLMVVIKGKIKPGREIDKMIDIITSINLKYNVLLSVYPTSEEEYRKTKSPLLMNIRKEGIFVNRVAEH